MRGVAEGRKDALVAGSDSSLLTKGPHAMPRLRLHYEGWVSVARRL
jgi:hypothetical protein